MVSGIGSVIGVYLGIKLAGGVVSLMSTTVSSLFLITRVEDIYVPAGLLIMGVGGGIGTSLMSALFPAKDAAFSPRAVAIAK